MTASTTLEDHVAAGADYSSYYYLLRAETHNGERKLNNRRKSTLEPEVGACGQLVRVCVM